jgi:proline iminopeptidase
MRDSSKRYFAQRVRGLIAPLIMLPILLQAQTTGNSPDKSLKPSAVHPKGDFAVVNGSRLWFESEGSGEPIVLIPGGPGDSHDYFHPYFSALSSSNRVIYYDAFGRGKSDRAKDPREYTVDRDVEDLEGLRKALHLGKINVLGHSYGGMVAQAYALRYPDSVRRLILADTFFSGEMWQANNDSTNYEIRNQFPEVWDKFQQVRAQGLSTCTKQYRDANNVPSPLLYFYSGPNANKLRESGGTENNDVYCAIAGDDADFLISGSIGKLDFRPDLNKLPMPILILAGRYDRVSIPHWSLQYKRYIPQGQFVMFERSGHFPFVEETEETMRVLGVFLAKQ